MYVIQRPRRRLHQPEFDSWNGKDITICSKISRQALGSAQAHMQW